MALLVTSSVQIARFANALYGVKLGSVTNAAVLEDISVLGSSTAFNSYYTSSFGSMTNAAVATTILANLGLAGNEAAQAYVEGQLNAAGSAKGAAVLSMLNAFSNLTSDATFGAAATAWNTKVSTAISYTASNTADVTTDFSAPVTSQTFTLTTSVDEATGGAGDDTIKGIVGTSGTYGVGDNINGGSGSDTLNLISNGSGIAGGLVSIESVETINVRLLSSAGEAVTLDATDWNGVETITNASSLASTVLTVTGLAVTTDVKLIGQTTVNAGFNNTTTASAAVNVILSDAGSGTTSTGYATLNVDAGTLGLISAVAVDLQGTTNAAYLEGGASVKTYTITGSGKGYLNTNDAITSFNAASATGNIDVTFSAASDVVALGGAGDDTFRFGTNYNNDDSFNGGAGSDTITLTQGSFNRNLNTTSVEKATVTFSEAAGGTLNASASTVTEFTIAGTAGAASVSQMADGATIKLSDDDITTVTLDYVSGALSTTISVGSASGASDVGALTVTDVASINLTATGSGGSRVSGALNFDADVKTVTITNGTVNSNFNVATAETVTLTGATTVNVTSSGSGNIHFGDAITANKLVSLNVIAAGSESSDVTVGDTSLTGSGIASITIDANGGADATLGALTLGTQGTASSEISLSANIKGASSNVTVGNISVSGAGTLTLDFSQDATGDISIGTITLARIDASGSQSLAIDTLNVAEGATVDIGAISLISAGSAATLSIDAITIGRNGTFTADSVDASDVVNVDLSDITISLGASAHASIGAISSTAGAIGAISLTAATGASATFGAIAASAVASISVVSIAASADITLGGINASSDAIGAIQVASSEAGADIVLGTLIGSAIGAVSVAGAGNFTMTVGSANTLGSIESTQVSGTFTIDLSGAIGNATVNLGRATNVITSGKGDDVITLVSGSTANDTIVYSTATQGGDLIAGFGAGSTAGDVIQINSSAMPVMRGSGAAVTTADAVTFLMFTGASATMTTATNIILMTTAFANTAAVVTQLAQVNWQSAQASGTDRVLVVWGNGTDTYVSVATVTASGAATTSFGSGSVAITDTTLLNLDGVSPGELVAANFDLG